MEFRYELSSDHCVMLQVGGVGFTQLEEDQQREWTTIFRRCVEEITSIAYSVPIRLRDMNAPYTYIG